MTIHPFFLVFQAGFSIKVTVTIYSITCFSTGKVLCGIFVCGFCCVVVFFFFFFCGMKKVEKVEAFAGIQICNTRNSAANIPQT